MFLPVYLLEEYKLMLDHFKGDCWLKSQEEEEDAVYVIMVFLSSCADWSVAPH